MSTVNYAWVRRPIGFFLIGTCKLTRSKLILTRSSDFRNVKVGEGVELFLTKNVPPCYASSQLHYNRTHFLKKGDIIRLNFAGETVETKLTDPL